MLNTGQETPTPVYQIGFERIAPLLAGKRVTAAGEDRLIETGIKVIDVMCPLAAGGTVALAGEYGAGLTVVMEELVRRLSGGGDPLSLFALMSPFSAQWPRSAGQPSSIAGSLKQEGYSEGTVGTVQTFFLRGQEEPRTAERLDDLAAADVVIHPARDIAKAKIYPAVDLRNSRSRLLDTAAVGDEHRAVATQVRRVLAAALWTASDRPDAGDRLMAERARKLQNYFTQPFFDDPVYLYQDVFVGLVPERRLNNGQPSGHAMLMAQADPRPGEHAVHIGAGVGYYTAIRSAPGSAGRHR